MGRTWISGTIDVDWVYYHRYSSERSVNSRYAVEVSRTVNRLALRAGANRLSTRERPGFEIDARSKRVETAFDGEATIRALPRTQVGAKAWRQRVEFDQASVFLDFKLGEELDRTNSGTAFVMRYDLTALTNVSIEIGRDRDRFVTALFRDSDSTRVTGGVTLRPRALISGSASFGYRDFKPLAADVPPYQGATGAVDLTFDRLGGSTRLVLQATRDLQPSFEFSEPYFLETGVTASVQQQVYGSFDVLVSAGVRRLAYRNRINRFSNYPTGRTGCAPSASARATASEPTSASPLRSHTTSARLLSSDANSTACDTVCPSPMTRKALAITAAALALCASAAVAGAQGVPVPAAPQEATNPTGASYVVGPRDVLVITSFDQPELTGRFTIEIDGTFTYPLIGRVQVGGLTLRAIEATLEKSLVDRGFFKDPQVSVVIEQYRSQRIYIVGEVRTPGAYPLSGDMRLVEALALAGSTLPSASGEAVIVRQANPMVVQSENPSEAAAQESTDQVVRVDLRELENGDLSQNVGLRGGDTVFVLRAESVYVFGQVREPGAYPLRQRNTTVLQALSLAGGVTDRASTGRIRIVRIVGDEREEIRVELTDFASLATRSSFPSVSSSRPGLTGQ